MSENQKARMVEVEDETDPDVVTRALARNDRFERNWAWLEAHATEVYGHRGKFICIAGEQLYVADSVEEAYRKAIAAHPDDDGAFTRYIPVERLARIYADRRSFVPVRANLCP